MSESHDPSVAHLVRCETRTFDSIDVSQGWFAPGFEFPRHRHDEAQVIVVLRGAMDLSLGTSHREFDGSFVFTEPAGDMHSNRIGNDGTHVLILTPHADKSELFRPCRRILKQPFQAQNNELLSLAWQVVRELQTGDEASALAVQGLSLELLACAARAGLERGPRPPVWLNRVEELLRTRCLETISIDEIAASAGVHPVHLSRTFKAFYRESVGAYVRRLRLDWSIEQLTSDESLANIAYKAGFSDQSHFSRAFKAYTGASPGAYRRSIMALDKRKVLKRR